MPLANEMAKTPTFTVLNDPNVQKIYSLPEVLSADERSTYQDQAKQTDEMGALLQRIQDLTAQLSKLQAESTSRYEALQQTHDQTLEEMIRLQERIGAYDQSVSDRVRERLTAMENGFVNLKAGIRDHAADFILDFRINGAQATARTMELFDIEGKLQWMRGCIANGVYELNKSMDKQARLATAYQKAYDAADTAMGEAGKDKSMLRTLAGMQRDFAAKKEEIFGKLIKAYETLGGHLDNMIERASEFVRNAHRNKDMRAKEKLEQADQRSLQKEIEAAMKNEPAFEMA